MRRRRQWLSYLGPWPLRPLPVFFMLGALALYALTMTARARPDPLPLAEFVREVAALLLAMAVLAGSLWLVKLFAPRFGGLHLPGYLVVTALAVGAANLTRRVLGAGLAAAVNSSPGEIVANLLRIWLMLLVIQLILGLASQRLEEQVDMAEAAAALAREQQELLIGFEERVRDEIARTLHDRVQAGLIAACLELQSLPEAGPGVRRVIQWLEDLRRVDVRAAARSLSPSLAEVGLVGALEELAGQYEPAMATRIEVDRAVDVPRDDAGQQLLLGCYRIAQQAMLNAAVHGQAAECVVTVAARPDGLQLTVTDNGVGPTPEASSSGLGTVIMNAWARTLGGQWTLVRQPGGGGQLTAELRRQPQGLDERALIQR